MTTNATPPDDDAEKTVVSPGTPVPGGHRAADPELTLGLPDLGASVAPEDLPQVGGASELPIGDLAADPDAPWTSPGPGGCDPSPGAPHTVTPAVPPPPAAAQPLPRRRTDRYEGHDAEGGGG